MNRDPPQLCVLKWHGCRNDNRHLIVRSWTVRASRNDRVDATQDDNERCE